METLLIMARDMAASSSDISGNRAGLTASIDSNDDEEDTEIALQILRSVTFAL